ncbi:hypothetical protein AABB24_009002 [Solanum stoloniferum]|uniref:Reverse transcriptase Ty1/copia-type domain-containing protein n=1 Tax=Solanum stoloniferum TaxID=62892 RepID=A0ABD2UJ28_9SOLN
MKSFIIKFLTCTFLEFLDAYVMPPNQMSLTNSPLNLSLQFSWVIPTLKKVTDFMKLLLVPFLSTEMLRFEKLFFPSNILNTLFLILFLLSHPYCFPTPLSPLPHPTDDCFPIPSSDPHHTSSLLSFSSSALQTVAPPILPLPSLVPQRRSSRSIKPPIWHTDYITSSMTPHPISTSLSYSNLTFSYRSYLSTLSSSMTEPSFFAQAANDSGWIFSMDQEIQALSDNNTWEIVDLPLGKVPIGYKWVYKIKYKADGSVGRFKARLVAKGFTQ